MSVNKKMVRNIIIAVLILGLLGLGYYFAVKWEPKTDDGDDGGMQFSTIPVFSTDAEAVTRIAYKNGDTEFSLVKSGSGDDAIWKVPEITNIEFSQAKLRNAVYDVTSVSATKEIGKAEGRLADYGLDRGDITLTVTTDSGDTTFILGDKLAVDSSFYMMKKGEDMIYTISSYSADAMKKRPDDFRETNLASIEAGEIKGISVSYGGGKIIELVENTDEETALQSSTLKMVYPYAEDLNVEPVSKLVEPMTGVQVIDFVSENTSDAAKYGISEGVRLVIKETDKTHTISFGSLDENGNIYAQYNDGYIFTMAPDMYNAVKDIKPFDLIDKFAHIYPIDDLESLTVNAGGKSHTLSIKRTGSGEEEKCDYSSDGVMATEDAFKGMYQTIIGLMVTDSLPEGAVKGDFVAEVTFRMTDAKVYTAKYYEFDDRSYIVEKPDGKAYLMLKKYVESMTETLEKFVENPKVRPEGV